MKKEIKILTTVCDCCETELKSSGIENGRYTEELYLKYEDIDLCYSCAGKIFSKEIVPKLSTEKLKEFVRNLKKVNTNSYASSDNITLCTNKMQLQVNTPFEEVSLASLGDL